MHAYSHVQDASLDHPLPVFQRGGPFSLAHSLPHPFSHRPPPPRACRHDHSPPHARSSQHIQSALRPVNPLHSPPATCHPLPSQPPHFPHRQRYRFTLNIAPDVSSKATGSLYIDDGATNSHQLGLWQRAEFSWSSSASGGILSFTAGSSCFLSHV
jgi:hypothetical protein